MGKTVWLMEGQTAGNQGNALQFENKVTETSPQVISLAWCLACMALALLGSGAGDSRKEGSHQARTGTGTRRHEQNPEEAPLLFSALADELPGSLRAPFSAAGTAGPSVYPPLLASSGQMPHPSLPPDEAR